MSSLAPGHLAIVESLAQALASSAIERDRAGGHAAAERELIRRSGLLGLSVPREHGGLGADWPAMFGVVRRLAQEDSALAHLFGFHHLQIASVLIFGNDEQQRRLLRHTIDSHLFWGNALNPLDMRLVATPTAGGWRLDGIKSYASGSVGSDRLTFSAALPAGAGETVQTLVGNIATRTPGITVREDWDSFGQRQTDSGTVNFDAVFLPAADVLQAPGFVATPRSTLRQLVSQLTMANLYLGIAQGALAASRHYLLNEARPWFASGETKAHGDPLIQHRFGDLHLKARAAQALADLAGVQLQAALDRGDALAADERGRVAIAIAEAKVLAHRASVEIASQLFELTGARSTAASYGLDRYWRNARVHTLHDPIDHKLREIGRHALTGEAPAPSAYS